MFGKSNYEKGLKLYCSGDYINAIHKLNKACKSGDLDVTEMYTALVAEGKCFNNLCQYDEAITAFECALQYRSDDYEAYKELGEAYIANSDFELSKECLDKAIELNPTSFSSWGLKGLVLFNLKLYDDAEIALNTALRCANTQNITDTDSINLLLNVITLKKKYKAGTELLDCEKYADAIKIYDSILESIDSIVPQDFDQYLGEYVNQIHSATLTNKGYCLGALNRYDSALKLYLDSFNITINYTNTYSCIAVCYARQNMFDKALEYFAEAENHSQNEIDKRGVIINKYSTIFSQHCKNKDYLAALNSLSSMPETDDDFICWKKMHLGTAHFRLEDYDKVLNCFLPYINNYLPDALFGEPFGRGVVNTYVGGVYYKRKDYQTALKYLTKCDNIVFERLADTGLLMGECYIALGDYEKALEPLQKAVSAWEEKCNYDIPYIESRIQFAKEKLGYSTSDEAECPVCPNCGAKVVPEDTFCRKCGNKLNENN